VRSADSRASRALRTAGRTRTLTDITRRTGQTGAEQHERTELRRGRDRRRLIGVVADPDRLARGATRIRWDTRGEAAEHRHAADQRNPVLDDVHVVSIPLEGRNAVRVGFLGSSKKCRGFCSLDRLARVKDDMLKFLRGLRAVREYTAYVL
jgi:hypothetical protein